MVFLHEKNVGTHKKHLGLFVAALLPCQKCLGHVEPLSQTTHTFPGQTSSSKQLTSTIEHCTLTINS